MADIAQSLKTWSQTLGSNLPTSSTTIGTGLAPNLQQIQSTLRYELATRSAAITAATTTDIGVKDEGTVLISNASGTVAITSFGTVSAGIKKLVTFNVTGGALSLTYNATAMILPSLASITVVDGDSLFAESLGAGNWKIHIYTKLDGSSIISAGINSKGISTLNAGATTLTTADLGRHALFNGATTGTATLPPIATCPTGSIISIYNYWTSTLTIARDGTSGIYAQGQLGVNSITLNPGDSIQLTPAGSNWFQVSGSILATQSALNSKIQPILATVVTNALTITLNPTTLDFRSTTLGSGAVTTVANATALTLVTPSTATLGTVSAVQSRLVAVAINNAGTIEVAVVNIAGGNDLSETGLISTTAISAAATANNVFYSTTARTSVAYRVVGYIDSTQATAGTWATAPSTVQGFGGQALASLSSIGYGQTWQDLTGSRALATTYYNTTGKPIFIYLNSNVSSNITGSFTVTISGISFVLCQQSTPSTPQVNGGILIPVSASYSVSAVLFTILKWVELR